MARPSYFCRLNGYCPLYAVAPPPCYIFSENPSPVPKFDTTSRLETMAAIAKMQRHYPSPPCPSSINSRQYSSTPRGFFKSPRFAASELKARSSAAAVAARAVKSTRAQRRHDKSTPARENSPPSSPTAAKTRPTSPWTRDVALSSAMRWRPLER